MKMDNIGKKVRFVLLFIAGGIALPWLFSEIVYEDDLNLSYAWIMDKFVWSYIITVLVFLQIYKKICNGIKWWFSILLFLWLYVSIWGLILFGYWL